MKKKNFTTAFCLRHSWNAVIIVSWDISLTTHTFIAVVWHIADNRSLERPCWLLKEQIAFSTFYRCWEGLIFQMIPFFNLHQICNNKMFHFSFHGVFPKHNRKSISCQQVLSFHCNEKEPKDLPHSQSAANQRITENKATYQRRGRAATIRAGMSCVLDDTTTMCKWRQRDSHRPQPRGLRKDEGEGKTQTSSPFNAFSDASCPELPMVLCSNSFSSKMGSVLSGVANAAGAVPSAAGSAAAEDALASSDTGRELGGFAGADVEGASSGALRAGMLTSANSDSCDFLSSQQKPHEVQNRTNMWCPFAVTY